MRKYADQVSLLNDIAEQWYESHRKKGRVNTNVMTAGIAVAELLKRNYPLTTENVSTKNGSQVRGLSGSFVRKVLIDNGENRPFTSEGGRTSRGTLKQAIEHAALINDALGDAGNNPECREAAATSLQRYFVKCIRKDFFDKKCLQVPIDPSKPVSKIVDDIFEVAKSRNDKPTGAVAQHLVGAKLTLRFPDAFVGMDNANAADVQTGRQGDFQLGNTAFHVTVSPSAKLINRVIENDRNGYRSVVLVPASEVSFASGLFKSRGWMAKLEFRA